MQVNVRVKCWLWGGSCSVWSLVWVVDPGGAAPPALNAPTALNKRPVLWVPQSCRDLGAHAGLCRETVLLELASIPGGTRLDGDGWRCWMWGCSSGLGFPSAGVAVDPRAPGGGFSLQSRAGSWVRWGFSARVCMMGEDKPGVFLVSGLPVRGERETNASASLQIKLGEIMSNLPIHAEGRDRSCLQLQLLTCESPKYARYLISLFEAVAYPDTSQAPWLGHGCWRGNVQTACVKPRHCLNLQSWA